MKKFWSRWSHLIAILVAAVLFVTACVGSGQRVLAEPEAVGILGEYRADGQWLALEEASELSALDGDVVIRGSFDREILQGTEISYYENHIFVQIFINGVEATNSGLWDGTTVSSLCGTRWTSFVSPGISPADTVEIHLHNPHGFGNGSAYAEFLDSLCIGSRETLRLYLEQENLSRRLVCASIMVISLVLVGLAIGFHEMYASLGTKLLHMGLACLFAGIYMILDTVDVSLWSRLVTLNTYGKYLGLYLAVLELGCYICTVTTGRVNRIVRAAVTVETVVLIIAVAVCLLGNVVVYNTLKLWWFLQMVLCPLLAACCLVEAAKRGTKPWIILCVCGILLGTLVVDLTNLWDGVVMRAKLSEVAFAAMFFIYICLGMREIQRIYHASTRTGRMANELKNSRIVLSMSQIRAHFVFNVLNAISGMCKYDPEKADETVVTFARYLRTNIDILEEDSLVPFHAALCHLEDYLNLEQIRFGNKIRFETDLEMEDFQLPSLILQPVVENAIKHGLMPKPQGGVVTLRTWEEKGNICISIRDDGVGFDTSVPYRKDAVGLNNVKFRLEQMMGGTMTVESTPGEGTEVTFAIPCKEAVQCM